MRHIFILCFATLALVGSNGPVSAKTCKCDQHNAEAAGGGTCSRTESADYCTISFPEMDASADFTDPSIWQAAGYKIQFASPKTAYGDLQEWRLKPVTADILATVAASAVPSEQMKQIAPRFEALFTNQFLLKEIVRDFNEDGCLERAENDFRILIIAQTSEKNGRCN